MIAFVTVTVVTIHALRRGLDFSLGWWSFTFPIGACAVGANAFGVATDSTLILGIRTCPADRTDPHLGNRRGQDRPVDPQWSSTGGCMNSHR